MKVHFILAAVCVQFVVYTGDAFRGFSVHLNKKGASGNTHEATELPERDGSLLKGEYKAAGEWIPATQENGYERSPCPALNTLANHGAINRDGRGIKVEDLEGALKAHYSVSANIATFLSNAGSHFTGVIDLSSLQEHGFIEHDVSLVHEDVALGNSTTVSPRLIQQLLSKVHDTKTGIKGITYNDLVQFRKERYQDSKAKNQALTFSTQEKFTASAEAALLYLVMGRNDVIPEAAIASWLGEEKFFEGYAPRKQEISFFELLTTAAGIQWRT
eukprot:GDKI01037609.1.p1 GENE.GDKI01037609.1~~GDKI01037609.1.p1  ORF type:complete len:273 (+),score=96.51 GDKI01037609.1:132-950(+)